MFTDAQVLTDLARSLTPPFAFCGIGLARAGQGPSFHIGTAPGIAATAQSLFRVASVSKIVTAQTLLRVAGAKAALDRDVAELLGFALVNPAYPGQPITLAMLLAHTSGLNDAAGYQVPAGTALADWFCTRADRLFLPHPPGAYFSYSNLGYILLAAAAEVLGAGRFDDLAQRHVLQPLGLSGGFNWSGVRAADRAARLATYRRGGPTLIAQIDGPGGLPDMPANYRPVQDTACLSPQGGLRLSLAGMLRLTQSLEQADHSPLWSSATRPGDTQGGLFAAYGKGVQILENPDFYPRPLVGHFANAYGFAGGVWWDAQQGAAFCYALNGLDMGDEADDLRPQERAIFAAVAAALSPA